MNPLFKTGARLESFCSKQQCEFCFIGDVAVLPWGEPRFTQDVYLTLLTRFQDEEKHANELIKHFRPGCTDALESALAYRVLMLTDESGVDIDIARRTSL